MSRFFEFANSRFDRMNDLSNRIFFVLLLSIIANILLLIIFPGLISFTVFLLSVFLMFLYSPFTPMMFWIILLPFENHLRQQAMISPFYASVFLISIYVFVLIFVKKEKIDWLPVMFGIVMIIVSALSLFTLGNAFVSVRNIISLSTVLIVFYALTLFMKRSKKSFFYINSVLFVSAALAMFFSVITTLRGYRFSLFDNVRSVSNILGIAIIFGVMYFYKEMTSSGSDKRLALYSLQGIIMIVYIFIMSIFLLFTVSRGVLLAVILALAVFFANIVISEFSVKVLKRVILFSILFIVFSFVLSLLPSFNIIGWDTIVLRFSQNFSENVRLEFWFYALEKLAESHLFFGIGLANFENFIIDGGYTFYSHSVFIDLIVSTGLVGLISITILSLKLLSNMFKERNLASWTILVYTLISFSTHGTVFSKFFWLSMALIIGVLDYKKI